MDLTNKLAKEEFIYIFEFITGFPEPGPAVIREAIAKGIIKKSAVDKLMEYANNIKEIIDNGNGHETNYNLIQKITAALAEEREKGHSRV